MADFIGPVVNLLLSVVTEHIKIILDFDADLGRLKDEVEMIQVVLHDAERRSPQDEAVKRWLKELAGFAEEAIDVLDEFAYQHLRDKVKKVPSVILYASKPFSKIEKGKKINELLTSLEDINKKVPEYGLQRGGGHAPPTPHVGEGRETTSLVNVFKEVVGREDDIAEIVKMLTSQSNQQDLSVLPIVGMGGLGKTTLAKQIYNHDMVKKHFRKRMWVCVSDEFNVKSLLKCILESLIERKYELDTKEAIVKKLQKKLKMKNYLLVLDDVWNENFIMWNEFVSDLQSVTTPWGNSILVTTRSTQVAKLLSPFDKPYFLEGLSDDDCWSIFSARAFPNGLLGDFEAIGREIVKKCRGLPLAAMVLGSMLASKGEIHEWLSIANDGAWNSSGVLPILKLSYDNLPSSSLKHCFSYCSIFRKDSIMEKDELVLQWEALGYLQPLEEHNNMEIEDIGNMYFNILVERSLFQDITTNIYGNIMSCKMHDFVHDLAQLVSLDAFNVEGNTKLASTKIPHIRHLGLYSNRVNFDSIGEQSGHKLRTLFIGNNEICKDLENFIHLRVLKLHESNELPTSIRKLKHLRYLYLLNTKINVLPDSIAKLYHLQTLHLKNCEMLESQPQGLQSCISLRNLKVIDCSKIKSIPNLDGLKSLRILDCSGCKMLESLPQSLQSYTSLCRLTVIDCSKLKSIPSLEGLNSLTDLDCSCCEMLESLPQGLQSCTSLRRLTVIDCGSLKSIPSLKGLNSLTDLNCSGCEMLESLPQDLQSCTSLRNLTISDCCNLKSISSLEGLNFLTDLDCSGCEMLESLPQGLPSCISLRNLNVSYCGKLNPMASFKDINGCSEVTSLRSYLTRLETLCIGGKTSFKDIQQLLRQCVSLRRLTLIGQAEYKTLPEQLQYLTALTSIKLESFEIEALPYWFGKLKSLEEIHLESMEKLKRLPFEKAMQRPTKLRRLDITYCPLLKARYEKGDHPEWSKISTIPRVYII